MVQMIIIPPLVLPHFYEMIYANNDSFLLDIDIICSSYSIILMMHITQIVSCHHFSMNHYVGSWGWDETQFVHGMICVRHF